MSHIEQLDNMLSQIPPEAGVNTIVLDPQAYIEISMYIVEGKYKGYSVETNDKIHEGKVYMIKK